MAQIRLCSECSEKLNNDEPDPHVDRCTFIDEIDRACNKWWREGNAKGVAYNQTRREIWRAAIEWAKNHPHTFKEDYDVK